MSDYARLAVHLPFLRRYARAVTGSQAQGDLGVRTALEGLAAGRFHTEPDLDARVSLYRLYTQSLASGRGLATTPEATPGSPDARLQHVELRARQVLLLSAVEGFSTAQIAQILELDASDVEHLGRDALEQIENDLATDVLVIEDEVIIGLDIAALTQELGHRVIDIARTRSEAVASAQQHRPGLILADIQLADNSSGADAVADISALFDVPVVFVTAFPERLLTGTGAEPTYLVSKPFNRNALKATIAQALFFHQPPVSAPA